MKRREDEAALRDAFALSRPGQDLGPAGRAYVAFRALSDRGDPFRVETLIASRKTPVAAQRAKKPRRSRRRARAPPSRRPAPVLAASAARIVLTLSPAGEALALWAADAALAAALNWPVAIPLLAGEILSPSSEAGGRRPRPGDSDWTKASALAYARAALAALDLADDLFRRAPRLMEAAPKLRAKGKGRALNALLDDDAISATHPIPRLKRSRPAQALRAPRPARRRARAQRPYDLPSLRT